MKKNVENNVCFLYIPFSVNQSRKNGVARKFLNRVSSSDLWQKECIKCDVVYGYIHRRLSNSDNTLKSCHVFTAAPKHKMTDGILMESLSICNPLRFASESSDVYDFVVDNIRLVFYGDSIGFVVFQVRFLTEIISSRILANTLYFLKKPTRTQISVSKMPEIAFTFYDYAVSLVKYIFNHAEKNCDLCWFFHISPNNARSNYLLMANLPLDTDDKSCKEALYYLMNGFCDKYEYREEDTTEGKVYFAPNGRCWGISQEASACLIRVDHERVEQKMFSEFKQTYFILYSFLLYQKYSYYHFLSKIDVSRNMRTKEIKKYHNSLIDFEIDSVFSVITDIPQYVGFYQRHLQTHRLAELRADVCSPISRLNETRNNNSTWIMTILGIILSLVGLISVGIDVYELILSLIPQ